MKKYAVTFVALALMFCAGCEKKSENVAREVVRPIRALKLEAPAQSAARVYPGKVDASDTAMLAFQAMGKVIELPVVAGQRVKKGELLARIDPREFEQELSAANAAYIEAKTNADRFKELHEKHAVATADMEQKVKDAEVRLSRVENARKALQDTQLVAPFDGIVSQRLIENFQNVKPGDVAVRVQDIEKLKVSVAMPESDVATTPPGSRDRIKAVAAFSAVPGREFPLKIVEVDTEADKATQTFEVKFLMDQPAGVNILPGMTAQVSVIFPESGTGEKGAAFTVPASAVFSDERGAACVWMIDPVKFTVHKRGVTLGEATGADKVRISAGLSAGETIALTGVAQLREGMKVRVIEGKIGE